MSVKFSTALIATVVALPLLGGGLSEGAHAQSTFNTQAAFDAATNTEKIDVPDIGHWGGTQCSGLLNTGGDQTAGAMAVMTFGVGNSLTATQINAGVAVGLCIFADAFVPGLANTNPNQWGPENLLVANGEDDYSLVLAAPVTAFALKILTNSNVNGATVTLKDAANNPSDHIRSN